VPARRRAAGDRRPGARADIVQRSAFLEFRITDQRGGFRAAIPAMDALLRSGKSELLEIKGGTMSALLKEGELPGEFFVAEGSVSQVDSLLRRPTSRGLVPRGLDWRWSAETIDRGGPHRALYALESRAIITEPSFAGPTRGSTRCSTSRKCSSSSAPRVAGASRTRRARTSGTPGDPARWTVQGRPPVIQDRIGARGRIEMGGRTIEEATTLRWCFAPARCRSRSRW
jgi:hypothetical protein